MQLTSHTNRMSSLAILSNDYAIRFFKISMKYLFCALVNLAQRKKLENCGPSSLQ